MGYRRCDSVGHVFRMRSPLRLPLLIAAMAALSPSAWGQVVVKPRVLVLIDTSGSMLQHFENNVGCGGDGDADSSYRDGFVGPNNWYPGTDGWNSRLYAAKHALSDVINATGDIEVKFDVPGGGSQQHLFRNVWRPDTKVRRMESLISERT